MKQATQESHESQISQEAPARPNQSWVRESRFGRWFLSSQTWERYVLRVAIDDFSRLLTRHSPTFTRILDAGCGSGKAFPIIDAQWRPETIIGVDVDKELLKKAKTPADDCQCAVEISHQDTGNLDFPDASFDIIFSHQLLHHTSLQSQTLANFYRVLKPGGLLLAAESCKPFIESLGVRLLFRHPESAQKTAKEFEDLIKNAGFIIDKQDTIVSSPWWSHPFCGLFEKLKLSKPYNEPTEILLVARKGEE